MYQGRILIVDDQEQSRDALELILYPEGYQLDMAANGKEALAKAREKMPDLVLLDVMMPEMNGYETCRQFREDPLLAEVPIIFITALADQASRLEGLGKGADDYIAKPVSRVELRIRTRNIIHLNRYRKLLQERARFEWVVEEAEEAYLLLDTHGVLQYANTAARRYLHLDDSGHLPMIPFTGLVRQYYQCEPAVAWEGDWLTEHTGVPRYLVRAESTEISGLWLQVRHFDPPEGGEGILLCLREVTEKIDRYQRTWCFHEIVSHKLNTPLNALNALELLLPRLTPELKNSDLELLKLVQKGAEKLKRHIAEIINYINMPFYSSTYSPLSLTKLGEIVTQIQNQLAIKVAFSVTPAAEAVNLNITHTAAHALIQELLNNAKRFHPQQEPQVDISLDYNADSNNLILRVTDDGKYLPAEVLDKVWIPYFQYEKYFTGELMGVGLGLPMVASIVWRLGGSCRMRNRPDKAGIIVELQFPAVKQITPFSNNDVFI